MLSTSPAYELRLLSAVILPRPSMRTRARLQQLGHSFLHALTKRRPSFLLCGRHACVEKPRWSIYDRGNCGLWAGANKRSLPRTTQGLKKASQCR